MPGTQESNDRETPVLVIRLAPPAQQVTRRVVPRAAMLAPMEAKARTEALSRRPWHRHRRSRRFRRVRQESHPHSGAF